jgi:hypothetical protein
VQRDTYTMYEMQAVVAAQIADFVKFPPRQKPASFSLNTVMQNLQAAQAAAENSQRGGQSGAALLRGT